jgi:NADPH:quinone reductase-like Zn-dependent oxidoreductase
MKAAQISEYGDASVIHVNEVDQPTPSANQVLVRAYAASLNPFDSKIRDGVMKDIIPLKFPMTLGGDIAGEVVEIGDDVSNFAVGDRVYGQANTIAGNSGAFAEFVAAKASQIARAPEGLDYIQAAALPLVGASVLQALKQHINLQSGQKIFIYGGAGGIGSVAIQVAKHMGAYVATTATGNNIEYVKSLGADEVVDYKAQDYAEVLHDFDAAYDLVGNDFNKVLAILKRGGVAVSMVAEADEAIAKNLGVVAIHQGTKVTTAVLDDLCQLVESGVVTPQIDQVFPLEQVEQAFITRERGGGRGKIVLRIS